MSASVSAISATSRRMKGDRGSVDAAALIPLCCGRTGLGARPRLLGVEEVTAAGSASRRACPVAVRRLTTRRGSEDETAGVPGPDGCPPVAPGMFSQYWLIAPTDGGPAHAAPGCAASAGQAPRVNTAKMLRAVVRTMTSAGRE